MNLLKKPEAEEIIKQYKYLLRPTVLKDSTIRYEFFELPVSKDINITNKHLNAAKINQYSEVFLNNHIMYRIMVRFLSDYFMIGSVTTLNGETIPVNKTLTDFCISDKKEINDFLMITSPKQLLDTVKTSLALKDMIKSFTVIVTDRSIEHNMKTGVKLDLFSDNMELTNEGVLTSDSTYFLTLKYKTNLYLTQTLNTIGS